MKYFKTFMRSSFSLILILLIFTLLCSCKKAVQADTTNTNMPPNPAAKKYLALGDSYTIGQSVPTADRFPDQANLLLSAQGVAVNTLDIIAVTGWTTANLINAINSNPPTNDYDFVTLLIGVNNQFQGRSIDEYKNEFTILLNRAIQYAGNRKSRVFVLSIPDYSVTPFAQGYDTAKIAREIDAFNLANKNITTQLGVTYIDITPISREAAKDPALVATDGLHPSGKQYKRWADLLAPLVKTSLQ
ncbi:MAG: SGNH/GDSL hydrolase family protein [Ferruginibacter sp.]